MVELFSANAVLLKVCAVCPPPRHGISARGDLCEEPS